MKLMSVRRTQEEMVGFVLIMVIVAVIILILLGIYLNKKPEDNFQKSEEVNRYLLGMLEYTSSCQDYESHYASLKDLVRICEEEGNCVDGRNSCDVLESELKNMTSVAWPNGEDKPVKGYLISVSYVDRNITISAGNKTKNYLGGFERISSERAVDFKVYV